MVKYKHTQNKMPIVGIYIKDLLSMLLIDLLVILEWLRIQKKDTLRIDIKWEVRMCDSNKRIHCECQSICVQYHLAQFDIHSTYVCAYCIVSSNIVVLDDCISIKVTEMEGKEIFILKLQFVFKYT